MQIEYKETFLTGYCDRKPTINSIRSKVLRKGFDVYNFECYFDGTYYKFKADIIPSIENTKELENEILSKIDILFQRKDYSKEEQTELKRLIWKQKITINNQKPISKKWV